MLDFVTLPLASRLRALTLLCAAVWAAAGVLGAGGGSKPKKGQNEAGGADGGKGQLKKRGTHREEQNQEGGRGRGKRGGSKEGYLI